MFRLGQCGCNIPYLGTEQCRISAPQAGTVAFVRDGAMTYESTTVVKLIPGED